ncbi:MAG: HEAT repeat domain-containing protein, partial [Pirellulales bacterium]
KAAVPELAKLLADEQLASWARIALEAIPDPAADEALRAAVGELQGKLLVGTINSIAVRRDPEAVELLASRLTDPDAEVAAASAVALGSIGNDAATKTLRKSLASAEGTVRDAVAEACVLSAEQLLRAGRADEAAEIYDQVRRSEVSTPRKLEATRGAILARKSGGVPLLIEQLRSPDRAFYRIGLSTARELPGSGVADALAAELARTSPDRATSLLYVLADRGEPAVLPSVLSAAKNGEKPVRIVALEVLGKLGDAASVDQLLQFACEDDAEVASAAKAAIIGLGDKQVDGQIVERLASAEGAPLIVLTELVGKRRIDATDQLVKKLEHADQSLRGVVLTALGATVGPAKLGVLIGQATRPSDPADAELAQQALRAACQRMPDRDACAAQLAAAMSDSPTATKAMLLEILGAMGGAKALESIDVAIKSNDPQLQDVGSRVLGEWMDSDAAPVLLNLAKNGVDDKYRVRALRGYIRLARQFDMPDDQRAAMCQTALDAASRLDEQKLTLTALQRHPNWQTFKVAVKATQLPDLQKEAQRTAIAIAEKLGGDGAKVREVLEASGFAPVKLEIVKAEYGADAAQKDVTELLQQHVDDSPLVVLPAQSFNESFGGDPAPGTAKTLKIQYRLNGKTGEAAFPENAVIVLPMPE